MSLWASGVKAPPWGRSRLGGVAVATQTATRIFPRFQLWSRSRLGDLTPPRSRLDDMKEGLLQVVLSISSP
jgi:hypothetical protein